MIILGYLETSYQMSFLKIFGLSLAVVLFIGCDNDSQVEPLDECQTLVGNQWDLVEYNGGWSGYYIFEEPYIHWIFYEADSIVVTFSDYKVTDTMGVPPNYLYAGTYDYVLDGEGGINISNESIS